MCVCVKYIDEDMHKLLFQFFHFNASECWKFYASVVGSSSVNIILILCSFYNSTQEYNFKVIDLLTSQVLSTCIHTSVQNFISVDV